MLGAGDTKNSELGLCLERAQSLTGEVGKQPTRSRRPKLKATDGREENFILGGHCRDKFIVVFHEESSPAVLTSLLRPLGIAEMVQRFHKLLSIRFYF